MMKQPVWIWITQMKDTIYFTNGKPENVYVVPSGIVAVIQGFTDVSELKQFFGLEDRIPKHICMSEMIETPEAVTNG